MPNTNTKLVDSKTIAALFDLTPRRIQQLTKEGIITATKEGNANRYDLLPTIQKYIRYLTAKANGREPSKRTPRSKGAGSRPRRPQAQQGRHRRAPAQGARGHHAPQRGRRGRHDRSRV